MELYKNKKAYFDYNIIEKFEAGIKLTGTEVKSCIEHNLDFQNAYINITKNYEIFLCNGYIAKFKLGTYSNHEEIHDRLLLMHKTEIFKLAQKMKELGIGYTLIPIAVYTNKTGFIKIEIAICQGKKKFDKRESLKEKQIKKEISRKY